MDTSFNPWSNLSPALIFIIEAESLSPFLITCHPHKATHSCKQKVKKFPRLLVEVHVSIRPLGFLVPYLARTTVRRRAPGLRVLYKALTDSKLGRINWGKSGDIPEGVRSPIIQALLQKLFLVTVPPVEKAGPPRSSRY